MKISRAAFSVTADGNGWICGSIFAPESCFAFDGQKFTKKQNMNFGHTDGAAMVYSVNKGLIIVGGREKIYYINNKGDRNPDCDSKCTDSDIVEQFKDNRERVDPFNA